MKSKSDEVVVEVVEINSIASLEILSTSPDLHARRWRPWTKWTQLTIIGLLSSLVPFCSVILAPALHQVRDELHVQSQQALEFTMCAYVLGYAVGPILIAPLSDRFQKRWMYNICITLLLACNGICAASTNLTMLVVFRLLAGASSACPLTLGAGSIADIFDVEQRGKAFSLATGLTIVGTMAGPAFGGAVADRWGWRWVFVGVVMICIPVCILSWSFLRESTARIAAHGQHQSMTKRFLRATILPAKLALSPVISTTVLISGIFFGMQFIMFLDIPPMLKSTYHYTTAQAGTASSVPFGSGMMAGTFIHGLLSDKIIVWMTRSGEKQARYRLILMLPGTMLVIAGLLGYGWISERHQALWEDEFCIVITGIGSSIASISLSLFLLEYAPQHAVAVFALLMVVRSSFGASLPVMGNVIIERLGHGWGGTTLAAMIVACWIALFALYFCTRPRSLPKADNNSSSASV